MLAFFSTSGLSCDPWPGLGLGLLSVGPLVLSAVLEEGHVLVVTARLGRWAGSRIQGRPGESEGRDDWQVGSQPCLVASCLLPLADRQVGENLLVSLHLCQGIDALYMPCELCSFCMTCSFMLLLSFGVLNC